ncbi:MAG: hypothetical protein H0T42_09605 [Deltaproteobacteria bacterium]|nr:hypothetical protein [Deltaproteobacteria bacterium]
MPNKQQRFDPSPTLATDVGLETAIQPFIDRFVKEEKRERATALFISIAPKQDKASWHELIQMIDTSRARPYAPGVLEPWNAVRGVFLVDHEAYAVTTQTAMGLYVLEDSLFVAYRSTFAVVRYKTGAPLLLT